VLRLGLDVRHDAGVRIEPLGREWYDAAVALWHETGLTRPWNDPDADLRRALAGPSSTVLGAFDGGVLTGTAMVGHDGHRGWVYYLGVAPAARRRGVGSALMRAAEAWVLERDVPVVNLMIRSGNDAAVAFYATLGYEVGDITTMGRRLDGTVRGREGERRE
jgi:ribosomal protein S18 acetylase RimI-like enzyme